MLQNIRSGLIVLLTLLLIRLCTLGLYPLYDPSESRYAEMARKMLETGNWVMPMADYDIPFWGKPPLTIWITALSLDLGGVNEFFARLPSIFLGIGIIWIIIHLVKVQRNTDNAFTTIIILASSLAFFVMSGTVAMDQCLIFGLTLALASFWLALRDGKKLWGYLFFIGLSVGLLAKGPITLVLAGTTIGLWTLVTGRWLDIWKRIPWITGTILMLCITLPWFLVAEQKTPGFLEYFIIGEHWKRFTEGGWKGDRYGVGHARPLGTIWIYWLCGGFPWTFVFLKKLMSRWLQKEGRSLLQTHEGDGWRLYCLLWMLAPLLFFTFSANIIWTYALPSLPGLALLLGDWLEAPQKNYRTILAFCVPSLFLALVLIYNFSDGDFFKSQKRLVDIYQQQATAGEILVFYRDKPYSAQFYLQGNGLTVSGRKTLKQTLAKTTHNFYIFHKVDLANLPKALKTQLVEIKSYGDFVLLQAITITIMDN